MWLNSTKLKKWRQIEQASKFQADARLNERKFTIKWKIAIYGKFVAELEKRLRRITENKWACFANRQFPFTP